MPVAADTLFTFVKKKRYPSTSRTAIKVCPRSENSYTYDIRNQHQSPTWRSIALSATKCFEVTLCEHPATGHFAVFPFILMWFKIAAFSYVWLHCGWGRRYEKKTRKITIALNRKKRAGVSLFQVEILKMALWFEFSFIRKTKRKQTKAG